MIFVIIAIIVVLVLWIIAIYNGLVKSRMQTKESWSQIDVQLKRRNDLIQNLIRSQVARAETPAEAMHASNALTKQLSSLIAVAENYPELKANNSFIKLQDELTNTENKISYSRQLFNTTTANYNVKLETFPSNIIAAMFGFKPSQFLETPEDEKETPKVSFDF